MKCINDRKAGLLLPVFLLCLCLTACGGSFETPYSTQSHINTSFTFLKGSPDSSARADAFASGLCVSEGSVPGEKPIDTSAAKAAAVFDLNHTRTLYASGLYDQLYPASLTKVMTAVVALKYGTPDMLLTASDKVTQLEAGAQTCGIQPGDTMTLDQALHLLLINSANDAAVMIAENVGAGADDFIAKMNAEAAAIGATATNFINSNGLSDNSHYTTAYDMYLIFNEAMKYSTFSEIINMPSYSTVYHDAYGAEKNVKVTTTNLYLRGDRTPPQGITVIGGKTGTTAAAGHCLVLLSRDVSGNPYISVVMGASAADTLYDTTDELLSEVQWARSTAVQ